MHAIRTSVSFVFSLIVLASIVQLAIGLAPSPRVGDNGGKYSDLQASSKQQQENEKYSSFGEKKVSRSENEFQDNNNGDDDDDDDDQRLLISEPYKTLIQTTTRFAVAQTGVSNYVHIDTFMDLLNDTGYALSHPGTLTKVLRTLAIALATIMSAVFFVPAAFWRQLESSWRNPSQRLMELERFLPNGLNEMGVVTMLNQKTDEMLARFGLMDGTCRAQSVCQIGQSIRCAFPKVSKPVVKFIGEHFSRPKYRNNNKFVGAFLLGFVDQNCSSMADFDPSKSCLSKSISSFSSCEAPSKKSPNQQVDSSGKRQEFQTIRAERA